MGWGARCAGGHRQIGVAGGGTDFVPFFAARGVSCVVLRPRLRIDGYNMTTVSSPTPPALPALLPPVSLGFLRRAGRGLRHAAGSSHRPQPRRRVAHRPQQDRRRRLLSRRGAHRRGRAGVRRLRCGPQGRRSGVVQLPSRLRGPDLSRPDPLRDDEVAQAGRPGARRAGEHGLAPARHQPPRRITATSCPPADPCGRYVQQLHSRLLEASKRRLCAVPPSFCASAGVGDLIHAIWATEYFTNMLEAKVPNTEIHSKRRCLPDGAFSLAGRLSLNPYPIASLCQRQPRRRADFHERDSVWHVDFAVHGVV